jgi:hypothetical protein
MTTFALEPYVGPLPLRFGMTSVEVLEVLGEPIEVFRGPLGNRTESYPDLTLGYSAEDELLMDAAFAPMATVQFAGINIFSHSNAIEFLRSYDDSPFEWVGFIIFLKLGIRLSGFHDDDESQKAVGIVKQGYWDEYIEDFIPYR